MYGQNRRLLRSLLFSPAHRSLLTLLCVAAGLSACAMGAGSGAQGEPEYHVSSSRPSSQVAVTNDGNRAIVEVFSENGIGNATVRLVSGEWPDSLFLRFHLQGLEGLQFLYGETAVDVSVNTQAQVLQSVSRSGAAQQSVDDSSDYWMPVTFIDKTGTTVEAPVPGGVIELLVPADFHTGEYPEFTMNWIDFYR
jgi:hypothetical protein